MKILPLKENTLLSAVMVNRHLNYVIATLLVVISLNTVALPNEQMRVISNVVPQAKLVGEARLTMYFFKIYDAQLYASEGKWQNSAPYALSLTYLRNFDGSEIAKRSIKEMREQGSDSDERLSKWQKQMAHIFPNVKEGDNIIGIADKNNHSQFYHNAELIGTIKDKEFTNAFFNIWLSEKTSEPSMRQQLIGK